MTNINPFLEKKIYNYDKDTYTLQQQVSDLFGVVDLSEIHCSRPDLMPGGDFYKDHILSNDVELSFHKLFYKKLNSPWNTFIDEYERFIFENIPQIIKEPFLYQKTPSFRIHLPKMKAVSEFHCDSDENYNHPIGEINFITPLTDMWDTNAVWAESEKMKGDYKSFDLSFGQFVKFNGNMCRHGNKTNMTDSTRVSFDFRVLPMSHTPAIGLDPEKFKSGSVYTKAKWEAGGYYKQYGKFS